MAKEKGFSFNIKLQGIAGIIGIIAAVSLWLETADVSLLFGMVMCDVLLILLTL